MEEWMLWLWLGIFVVALMVEFGTANMVSIWFALAAIPSFILALFNANIILQIVLFVVISILLLVVTRPLAIKYFKTNEIKTNVDLFMGSSGVCISDIEPSSIGRVKVRNQEWSAISSESIHIGENVRVLDVEGAKLIVEKID
ncbi:MAG: NfeD family protein [Acholeplasmataceae bacterium]|nr:NfeD family protein [Acholeplasmataceae bacterium]